MASTIGNIRKLPELRRRLLFTLICLAVYRVGIFVTTPGVNRVEMKNIISSGGSGSAFRGCWSPVRRSSQPLSISLWRIPLRALAAW